MRHTNKLHLHEEILLLALRDKQGTIASGTMYQFAIGGAILAELLLDKKISVDESKKKKLVDLVDPTPYGDPVIDESIEKIRTAKRRASLQTWVSRFSNLKRLKHRVAGQLCRRGILKADEDKVLGLFKRKIYPELSPKPERMLIERLREAIFTDSENLDRRTVVLVSLADKTGLLKANFDKKELKKQKARIKKIAEGEMTGKAAKDAIDAMHAAVMVTVMVSTM